MVHHGWVSLRCGATWLSLLVAYCNLFSGSVPARAAGLMSSTLQVEWRHEPVGIDCPRPLLSWKLDSDRRGDRQTAYQVLVASRADQLSPNVADLWDSGKVTSTATLSIPYDGRPLTSGQQVFWTVRVWDVDDQPSDWAAPSQWTMGLIDASEWQTHWISYRDMSPLHDDRKTFGTAWTDAEIICPWTIWQVYGDRHLVEQQWPAMTRFMEWRIALSKDNLGLSVGNTWGDWLNAGEETDLDFIDTVYFARDAAMNSFSHYSFGAVME